MTLVLATLAGEVAIKGRGTRSRWVRELVNNVAAAVNLKSWRAVGGTLELEVEGDYAGLSRTFGIAWYAPATAVNYSSLQDIVAAAERLFADAVRGRRFAVMVRREAEDRFTSIDVERAVGEALTKYAAGVNLSEPEVEVHIRVSGGRALMFSDIKEGPRGLPVGVAGRTVALVSGGFDSPVATWMMMKRGVVPVILSVALGGQAHREAVLREAEVLRSWSGAHDIRVYFVDGAPVFEALAKVKDSMRSVVLRRVMYRLAEALARRVGAHSITTGESLSQVSSQTMWNLEAESRGVSLPILRPLIGFDKDEIVGLARRVGTYSISEHVPEYCAVAIPANTRAWPEEVDEAEKAMGLDYVALVKSAEAYLVARDGVRQLRRRQGVKSETTLGSVDQA